MYAGPRSAGDGMDSFLEVKEALVARSKTTSLDDLKSQGRSRVKVIRAEHIAAMVQEAVQKALGDSGMMSREEVDKLVERSQTEFRNIIEERERQLGRAREAMRQLEEVKAERVRLQASMQELLQERNQLREELERQRSQDGDPTGMTDVRASAGGGANVDLMMKLMNEVAQLKASMMTRPGPGMQAVAGDASLTAAIDKLAGSLNERLEKFGRKLGVSSAVEARNVKFDGLFEKTASANLESNMDSVQMKKKQEGGIAANLERLRKLKGDG